MKSEFGFKEFAGKFEFGKDFGFEKALKFLGYKSGFLEYQIPVSVCKKETNKRCWNCKGSGKGRHPAGICLYCEGGGKEFIYDYKEAYAISSSFSLLFQYLQFPKEETTSEKIQLISVETAIAESYATIDGEYGGEIVNFLRKRSNERIPEMVETMKTVYAKMDGGKLRDFFVNSFDASTQEGGRLIVNCPGDACGLGPNHNRETDALGYEFSCHNVDQPIQQLTLLSALAKLHDLVRAEE